jgi:mono/diheme cytochrome c family protein
MTAKLSCTLILGLFWAIAAPNADAAQKTKIDIAKLPPAATKASVTFAADIKPMFQDSCVKCHGADKPKAKLRLDSLEAVLQGSEHGKVVQPGKSGESRLIHLVAQLGDPDDSMPPPNNKAKIPPLTKEQIGLVRAWIDQGAK